MSSSSIVSWSLAGVADKCSLEPGYRRTLGWRRQLGLAAVLCLALVPSGCHSRRDQAQKQEVPAAPVFAGESLPSLEAQGKPTPGGVLRIAMESEPPTLNAQLDPLDPWARKIGELVFDSLVGVHPRSFAFEPRLAGRWSISPDKRTYTFYLRKDIKWQDGRPFTADDVIFTFDKLLDPSAKTMAVRSYLEPFAQWAKVDPYTVRFHLRQPYWYALEALAKILIYPQHVYESGDFNTHPANREPLGTGPYKFLRWKTGDEVVLVRNREYFGKPAYVDRLVFKYVPEVTVRVQMAQRGDIDVLERVPPQQWRILSGQPQIAKRFHRLRHVPLALQWIGWNLSKPLFGDVRVRRALTMLIDRDDIVGNLRLGLDEIAASWFYPGAPEFNPHLKPLPYDPKQAQVLLGKALWVDTDGDGVRERGKEEFEFTFIYPRGSPFYEQLGRLMRSEFAKAGIRVNTARLEWAVFMERLRRHEFDACSMLWRISPRSDPYQIWHSSSIDGGSNFISFRHPGADRLLEQARGEFDPAKRTALYHRFARILSNEQPFTFLFHRYNLSLVSRKLGGVYSTPYGIFRYEDIYLHSGEARAGPAEAP